MQNCCFLSFNLVPCVILFSTIDLGRSRSKGKNSEAESMLSIWLFCNHVSLSMLISFKRIKRV